MTGEISSDQAPRFQFIDISSSHARKDARAHVMREFMRMKREEQPDVETPAKTSRKRPKKLAKENAAQVSASKRGRLQETIEDPKDLSTSESDVSAHQSTASDASSSLDAETTLVKRANMRVVTSRSGSPQSPVDASRRDPFQAFPMRLDEEDLPLVDHCESALRIPEAASTVLTRCVRHHRCARAHVQLQRDETEIRSPHV